MIVNMLTLMTLGIPNRQEYSYDVIAISETRWNESHNWSAGMEGYRLFRRDSQGRRGGGVALYVRERFDCTALTVHDDVVESLWVGIRGMENKGDVVVGAYNRSPSQDAKAQKLASVVSDNKKGFKYVNSKRRSKKNIGLILVEDGHLKMVT
ncbi:hypothetical protein QYF61_001091 [Mycteria americana]|uniref:Uncharacterized protein n=1 Tax=Mycteria americana TaxID=33587 RepID=A0AAN7N9M2_MYCAM|nr:hypothetical protein QYF61_001091 [Mycteria americana]